MAEETNPLETTLQSTSGKISTGVAIVSVIIAAIQPFLPDFQAKLAAHDYAGLILTAIALIGAVVTSVKLHSDRTKVKVAMISANTLPMSNQPKL